MRATRSGDLTQALNAELLLSGTAVAGQDYQAVDTSLNFPIGIDSVQINVIPTSSTPDTDVIKHLTIRVVPDPTRFGLIEPGSAELQFLALVTDQTPSFSEWRDSHFPGDPRSDSELAEANDDGDSSVNIFEYLRGTDPDEKDATGEGDLRIRVVDGHLEITTLTRPGLSGVATPLDRSDDLRNWSSVESGFSIELRKRDDGLINRVYRSSKPISELDAKAFHRLRAILTPSALPTP